MLSRIFIHQHEDKDQNIDYKQPNDKNKFHAFQERFNSPTTWLFRERERRQNFKIDSQIHSFTKINPRCSNMIFSMIASSLFSKYSLA
ncbi:hypothetical protein [Helicobacter pylori]|uniref:hypothetical protein n=1 Tax=Helicobacter pylori TaxID=210 RepID=UPI0002E6FB9F|nr:hypothetical protein [Helicobacter pylori]